jgi:hypothetical protein
VVDEKHAYYLNRKRQNYQINGTLWKIKHYAAHLKYAVNFLVASLYEINF